MKKFILLAAISGTFIMCKKAEATQDKINEAIYSADSAATVATETIDHVSKTADKVLDSASIKIKDFENTKNDIRQKIEHTSKMVDSLSDKIAATKLESKIEKKDSMEKRSEKIAVKAPAPKVIKETKIIYREKPKNDSYKLNMSKDKMVKSGYLVIRAENAETVKEIIREEANRNNGYIKSENLSYVESASPDGEDQKVYSLDIKVPMQHFDGLMEDINSNVGDIDTKDIQVSGRNYMDNAICTINVNISEKAKTETEPKTFGGKSLAAIESGWDVITSIFLFILPLWPLFLIAGIGYYFYKKKNKNIVDNDSH
ncbi:hypothetical protein J2795_002390 [Chryseobacterium bernardetii]|uniref:Uncharacterized protein DUF4349 n=2 Tax=Chryseobacterium TaxID=59732 RepID=A0A543EGC9_9FLAO|nr:MULTISPECIES: DUF4349 domain-containing protein [Chryseobacterium]MDR6370678.1 hypothetical protein [Chryseobacterium vietnamense]MDR6441684.1 hypothetical protein [Chryseobacterium bernardetii]TQM20635.1 uncharacterized protein DUF4349 [Chryseobacterium aquifrigidense]